MGNGGLRCKTFQPVSANIFRACHSCAASWKNALRSQDAHGLRMNYLLIAEDITYVGQFRKLSYLDKEGL